MVRSVSCPVNGKQVDENLVRIIAAQVALLTVLSILLSNYWIAAFLCVDFLARASGFPKLSLLRWSSSEVLELLNVPARQINAGAKQFAARLGTVLAALLFSALLCESTLSALLIGGMLSVFSLLEAALGICIGCYAYHWLPNG